MPIKSTWSGLGALVLSLVGERRHSQKSKMELLLYRMLVYSLTVRKKLVLVGRVSPLLLESLMGLACLHLVSRESGKHDGAGVGEHWYFTEWGAGSCPPIWNMEPQNIPPHMVSGFRHRP